jgi:hypothetical protein
MQTPAFAATKTVRKSKLFRGLVWVAAMTAACLCPTLAFGQTNSTWNGGTGNWSTSTDWTPNQVPNNGGGNTYNVTINSGLVTLDQNATINSLVLGGELIVGYTLDLTNQPSGITDVTGGSALQLDAGGTIMAGSKNALANLNSVEGNFTLSNGQMTTITPGSGTLTIGGTGSLDVGGAQGVGTTTLTISGNLNNSGLVDNNHYGGNPATPNILDVTGTLTNQVGATLLVQEQDTTNVGALINSGNIIVQHDGVQVGGFTFLNPTLNVSGTLTNYGTISIGTILLGQKPSNPPSELILGASSVNSGTITLVGAYEQVGPDNFITGATASVVLTNEKMIEGGGNIGDGSMGLVNSATGTIDGNSKTPLTIQVSSTGFQNNGKLVVVKGSTLDITGAANSFLNFNSSIGTLTGGTYLVTGTLQFDNANIVTNAASITLTGTASTIEDQNGDNALANFSMNASAGSFILEGDRNFTTSGTFNNAGKVTISSGSTFTVGGTNSYKQTAGTTTVSGTLAVASPGGMNVSGGSVFGIGAITGNIDLTGGLLSPGAASKKAGELTLSGTYTQSGAGAFDVDLAGTTAGTQYDVLDITSTATLGGVLNVDLISGFKPSVGDTFDIIDYTSETGTFTTLSLPKLTGGDTWAISYNATGVVLTVDGPAAVKGVVSGAPAKRVSRELIAAAGGMREAVAILSRATCFGARLLMASAACGWETVATVAGDGERRATGTAGIAGGTVHNNNTVHNNIMGATRGISGARGGASRETSASATAMARLYVCAYLPSSAAHRLSCD